MKILFFDMDQMPREYFEAHPLPAKIKPVLFSESIQDVPEEMLKRHSDAEAISVFVYSRLRPEIYKLFPRLRMVNTRSSGINGILPDYCKKHGLQITTGGSYAGTAVPEFAMGLLLNLTRKITFSNAKIRAGEVKITDDMGVDIGGKTIGIFGTGSIGAGFARLAKGFGCEVVANDPYHNPMLDGVVKYASADTVLKQADFIILCCSSTPENYHMINAKAIAKMKTGAFIINVARGDLIDSVALYHALRSGKIAGAGLDVLEQENLIIKNDLDLAITKNYESLLGSVVGNMIMALPNVIMTPHIAFNSLEANKTRLGNAHSALTEFAKGLKKPVPARAKKS